MPHTARQALSEAIRDQHEAQAALHSAEETYDKGQALLSGLYAQLSEYDTLDQQIADARANAIRIALERGIAPDFHAEPSGFASKLVARDRIRGDIEALLTSLKTLEQGVARAKQHADQCALEVEWCAETVVAEEAETLAKNYLAQLNELRATAYLLSALSLRQIAKGKDAARLNIPSHAGYLSVASGQRRINMPPVVGEALQENIIGNYERKNGFALRNRMGALANEHWGKLLNDADAELDAAEPTPVGKANVAALAESTLTLQ